MRKPDLSPRHAILPWDSKNGYLGEKNEHLKLSITISPIIISVKQNP